MAQASGLWLRAGAAQAGSLCHWPVFGLGSVGAQGPAFPGLPCHSEVLLVILSAAKNLGPSLPPFPPWGERIEVRGHPFPGGTGVPACDAPAPSPQTPYSQPLKQNVGWAQPTKNVGATRWVAHLFPLFSGTGVPPVLPSLFSFPSSRLGTPPFRPSRAWAQLK